MQRTEHSWGFINGLRGLLALWVVAGHSLNAANAVLFDVGVPALAVDGFMIISGFLMAAHFQERAEREPWESPRTWLRFYLRRFLRIAPAYYLVLVAAFLTAGHYATWWINLDSTLTRPAAAMSATVDVTGFEPTWRSFVLHLTFLFGFLPKYVASIIAIPDWSIALEMQFYLAFPFLMLALRRWGTVLVTGVMLATTLAAHQLWGVYSTGHGWLGVFPQPSFLPFKLSWFFVGILFADSVHQRDRGEPARAALSAGLGLFLSYRGHGFTLSFLTFGFLVLAHRSLLIPALGRAAGVVSKADQLLSSKVGALLADCSYPLYLIHFFVLFPLEAALRSLPGWSGFAPLTRAGVLYLATLAVALPVSYALHLLVERPGIELGRRLLRTPSLQPTAPR